MKLRISFGPAALILALLAILAVTGAFAEDAAPDQSSQEKTSPAPPGPQQTTPQKFYFEVDQGDLNVLSQALNDLPYKLAAPILLKLNGQLQAQAQVQIVAAKDTAEKMKKGKK